MAVIKLALEEGYDGDRVVVTAGEHLLADETEVTTRYQISLARLVDLDIPDDQTHLMISLPNRHLEKLVDMTDRPTHLRASISRDGQQIETSTEVPIGYA